MGVHRKSSAREITFSDPKTDKEKIYYLYWKKLCSIEEIEQYFKGKYTYREVKSIIKERYKEYYDKENVNGR